MKKLSLAMLKLLPNAKWISIDDTIENLTMLDGTRKPTENEINEKIKELDFKDLKIKKTNEINIACRNQIIGGFKSSAKGDEYTYQSDEVDQLNLIGAVTTGVRQKIKCSSDDGLTWQWLDHLNSEIKQVLKDGAVTKATYLQKAAQLKNQVSTESLDQLDQIKW